MKKLIAILTLILIHSSVANGQPGSLYERSEQQLQEVINNDQNKNVQKQTHQRTEKTDLPYGPQRLPSSTGHDQNKDQEAHGNKKDHPLPPIYERRYK